MTAIPDPKSLDAKAASLAMNALFEFRPPQKLTASEWAEEHHVENGSKIRLIPYQKQILNCFSDPEITEVVFAKSARVGATTIAAAGMNYIISEQGGAIGITLPTEQDGRDFSGDVLSTSLNSCIPVRDKLKLATKNNDLLKVWPGGSLRYMFAASPRTMRRHNLTHLVADEVAAYNDAMKTNTEGDPLALSMRRLQNASPGFAFICSSPVELETDLISYRFLQTDQRHYHVPCPHCGGFQHLIFDNLRVDEYAMKTLSPGDWPPQRVEASEVTYQCNECGEQIREENKKNMLELGEWVAHAPELAGNGRRGYFVSTILSPFPRATWPKLVMEYLEAKKSPDTLKTFVNTVEGLPWSLALDNLDPATVKQRTRECSLDMVPADILQLTMGIDFQGDRAEAVILGFQSPEAGGGIVILDRIVIMGDPSVCPSTPGDTLWSKLDDLIAKDYQHELGGRIGLSIAAADSGNWADQIYRWTGTRNNLHPIKGRDSEPSMWRKSKSKGKAGAAGLQIIGTNAAKTYVFQRLTIPTTEPGALTLAKHLATDEVVEQLLSERRVFKKKSGRLIPTFELLPGVRNEILDCVCYAASAAQSLRVNWDAVEARLTVHHATQTGTAQAPEQSALERIREMSARRNQSY